MSQIDQLLERITTSNTLSEETREILNVFALLLRTTIHDRDEKMSSLEREVKELRLACSNEKFEALHQDLSSKTETTFQTFWKTTDDAFKQRDALITQNNDRMEAAEEKIEELADRCAKLERKNRDQSWLIDEQDAYIRRESLLFSGDALPEYKDNENCSQIVREIIRNKLGLAIDPLISTAHRMGPPPPHGSGKADKRDIVARFCERHVKYQVYTAARKKKVVGLYVNEHLTKTRKSVHYALRKISKSHKKLVTGTTTHNGRIFVYTKPSPNAPENSLSIKTEINTIEKLEDFCLNFLKEPLCTFLPPKK